MSLSSKQLEAEIQAMESRLASAKITVEIEKTAWQKVARKGKSGAKWKGSVVNSTKTSSGSTASSVASSRSEVENADGEIVVAPIEWDALELAQYLQAKQLAPYAQLVVYEHITGKLLLSTAPGKLRNLFDGIVTGKTDPTWKNFLRVCSHLHKLQKSMDLSRANAREEDEDENNGSKPRAPMAQSSGTVFPLISPRLPAARAVSSLSTKPQRPQPPPPMSSLVIGDADGTRLKTPAPHYAMAGRKAAATSNPSHTQQMVTCWNCSARFPRTIRNTVSSRSLFPTASSSGSKATATKLFCSRACQDAIESSDMSVSASLSLAVPQETPYLQAPKAPPSNAAAVGAVTKSPRSHPHGHATTSGSFSFLHVTPTGPQTTGSSHDTPGVTKQPSGRKRVAAPPPPSASSGGLSPVASITAVRCLSDDLVPLSLLLHGARSSSRLYPRVLQQSRYKLDPELYHAHGIGWTACFDTTAPLSPARKAGRSDAFRITNLETLVGFLSTKTIYRLSLTSRKWFELVHTHPATIDRVWGLLLHRAWIQDEADHSCLRELGFVSTKMKRPRRVMMKLTRQVQKTVWEGMKILLSGDNWQLAPTCRNDVDYLPLPHTRWQWAALHDPNHDRHDNAMAEDSEPIEPTDRGNDLYEVITVICNRACEIVAVQAQELIRPIADDGSTVEILKGVKNGSLWSVECRRLRLFSVANRLPVGEWYLLPDILVMLEFCMAKHAAKREDTGPSTWQLKVLSRLQLQMDKRLLAKESVQQVMKWAQERNAPDQALVALEQFLVRHAPALVANASGKPRG